MQGIKKIIAVKTQEATKDELKTNYKIQTGEEFISNLFDIEEYRKHLLNAGILMITIKV